MNRPDVEGIEKRLKELIAGPTYTEALYLIGWIHQLELDLNSFGNLAGERFKELEELRAIGEEFIERRDKGEIRSTYTYNKLRRALGRDDSGTIHICGRAGFVFGNDVCPACEKRDNHKWKE